MTVCSRPVHLKNENLFFPVDMKEQRTRGGELLLMLILVVMLVVVVVVLVVLVVFDVLIHIMITIKWSSHNSPGDRAELTEKKSELHLSQ